jgi:hypothetical protein
MKFQKFTTVMIMTESEFQESLIPVFMENLPLLVQFYPQASVQRRGYYRIITAESYKMTGGGISSIKVPDFIGMSPAGIMVAIEAKPSTPSNDAAKARLNAQQAFCDRVNQTPYGLGLVVKTRTALELALNSRKTQQ